MRGTEFLEKMELVDPVYIEAADQLPQNTPREKSRRTTAAALRLAVVLCAVFAIVFLCRAYIKKPVVPHKDEFSGNQKLAEYTSIYDGTLLAARLAPPGTRISEILLKYAEDGDVSEPSTWKSLSVSVEYEDSSVNLFCLFDGSAESDPSSELLETLQYGDTTVRLFRRKLPESSEYKYFATFEFDGVFYKLSAQKNTPERLKTLLKRILRVDNGTDFEQLSDSDSTGLPSAPDDTGSGLLSDSDETGSGLPSVPDSAGSGQQSGSGGIDSILPAAPEDNDSEYFFFRDDIESKNPFLGDYSNFLGFDNFRIEMEELSPWLFLWHYYTGTENNSRCVAEAFSSDNEQPDACLVDLDNDGITELICNCRYNDGAERIFIYRSRGGIVEEGRFDEKYFRTDFPQINTLSGAARIVQRYEPEKGVFLLANYEDGEMVNIVYFTDTRFFKFQPFAHDKE